MNRLALNIKIISTILGDENFRTLRTLATATTRHGSSDVGCLVTFDRSLSLLFSYVL
jgi:hypothetical protein